MVSYLTRGQLVNWTGTCEFRSHDREIEGVIRPRLSTAVGWEKRNVLNTCLTHLLCNSMFWPLPHWHCCHLWLLGLRKTWGLWKQMFCPQLRVLAGVVTSASLCGPCKDGRFWMPWVKILVFQMWVAFANSEDARAHNTCCRLCSLAARVGPLPLRTPLRLCLAGTLSHPPWDLFTLGHGIS